MSEKKKKEKVKYYDDGRTIADMSGLYNKSPDTSEGKKSYTPSGESEYKGDPYSFTKFRPGHTPKDWAKTYWNSVKTMFLPMLATLGIISAAFLILWLLLELAS